MASREHALLRHTWNNIIPRLSTEVITSSVRGCEKHLRTAYIHFLADLAWVLRCSLACFVKTHYSKALLLIAGFALGKLCV